jgi:peptidoglycan hydrolase-like protein with peptidoglycan-binding domain
MSKYSLLTLLLGVYAATLFSFFGVTGVQANSDAATIQLNRDLSVGMTGEDVRQLQIFLNTDSETQIASGSAAGAPGFETSYYGALTANAVTRFQEKYAADILAPLGLTRGTGYLGASTRQKIAERSSGTSSISSDVSDNNFDAPAAQATTPFIKALSPSRGPNETEIIIVGSNFDSASTNTVLVTFDDADTYTKIPATSNGTSISFVIDNAVARDILQEMSTLPAEHVAAWKKELPEIPVSVRVLNSLGESNFKVFTIELE